jgi:hypothetical protein
VVESTQSPAHEDEDEEEKEGEEPSREDERSPPLP